MILSGFINDSYLINKRETWATKRELKAEKEEIVNMETYDLSELLGNFLCDNDPQNVFV